eukprot:scaffold4183_cov137-Cylindrotheca_fusiformis.AAC.13
MMDFLEYSPVGLLTRKTRSLFGADVPTTGVSTYPIHGLARHVHLYGQTTTPSQGALLYSTRPYCSAIRSSFLGKNNNIQPTSLKIRLVKPAPVIMANFSDGKLPLGSERTFSPQPYFTELTVFKVVLYTSAFAYVLCVMVVSAIEPFLTLPCDQPKESFAFPNPAYEGFTCKRRRHWSLLGMNREECSFGRRLVCAVVLGSLIGWERRQADRPAGIRTMSMVSLGSCLFTINSAFAFIDGPMSWDSSRVSAAIPSGVGFLGAGLIFKKEDKNKPGEKNHIVHGLTTAASLWLSAAVGIACGGEIYFPACFVVALMMLLLRFAPRGGDDNTDNDSDTPAEVITGNFGRSDYASTDVLETTPLSERRERRSSNNTRNRRSLASAQRNGVRLHNTTACSQVSKRRLSWNY